MRKIYFLAASLVLSMGLTAQTNLGLNTTETVMWNGVPIVEMTGWDSYNLLNTAAPAMGGTSSVTASTTLGTTNPAEGTGYAKMTSFDLTGLSGYGVPDGIYPGYLDQAFPFTDKIQSVTFSYRSNLTTGDQAIAFVTSSGPGHDFGMNAIGQAIVDITTNESSWKTATATMNWVSPDPIDSIEIVFGTSAGAVMNGGYPAPTVSGSVLEVDNVFLTLSDGTTAGIETIKNPIVDVTVYPNPTSEVVNFAFNEGENVTEIRIFSATGQLMDVVKAETLTTVNVKNYAAGTYFFRVLNNNEVVRFDKFIVK
ncbi:MAG: T9SS type A sorting domain-containing protein [Brumimicrobium sp.]|nr:T9SS type A sorting domain-containing protein [Brumimicrobium sp.]